MAKLDQTPQNIFPLVFLFMKFSRGKNVGRTLSGRDLISRGGHCILTLMDGRLYPFFVQVWPGAGPTSGGTELEIRGVDLGKSFDDVKNSVAIGKYKCVVDPAKYEPARRWAMCRERTLHYRRLRSLSTGRTLSLSATSSPFSVPSPPLCGLRLPSALLPEDFLFLKRVPLSHCIHRENDWDSSVDSDTDFLSPVPLLARSTNHLKGPFA